MTWQDKRAAELAEPTGAHAIEAQVLDRLGSRLLEFSLDDADGTLVLRGRAQSYHVKQLAQHAVMAISSKPISCNRIEVMA